MLDLLFKELVDLGRDLDNVVSDENLGLIILPVMKANRFGKLSVETEAKKGSGYDPSCNLLVRAH